MGESLRPFQHLPMPHPRKYDPAEKDPLFFYKNFVKHFIADTIEIMDTGLHVDQKAVEELRSTIADVLKTVTERLEANDLIKAFQNSRLPEAQRKHAEAATSACRDLDYYLKPYKPGDMVHRTWVVNTYLERMGRSKDCQDKWSVKDLKAYNVFLKDPFLSAVIDKRELSTNETVVKAMKRLAQYKLDLWNRPRFEKAQQPVELPDFNPGSPQQKAALFAMLGIPPMKHSKDTGEASWGRDQLEELLKQTDDPDLIVVLEALIDHSYSAIIRNNFLKAFDSFTIDGVLHGNIRLFGAKSFRPTSNSPNLLNMPSSKSIYAKPLKKCFVAPPGYVVYTADLSALEDRVIANLTGDRNKQDVFLQGLDGHSLNACGYFADQIAEIMGPVVDRYEYIREFYRLADVEEHPVIKKLRSASKAPTFKLAYGGYPDADKGGVITQQLFDNYHNVLYPGITDYRENYVLPTTRDKGYLHLGLGCRMYSSNPSEAIRTLHNATVQFWSILTLIAINELNFRKREAGITDEVKVCSTIYDSIYTYSLADPEVLKWTNDNLIECMTVQYLDDEPIRNEAEGEIGMNWAELHKVPNNASEDEIEAILDTFYFPGKPGEKRR